MATAQDATVEIQEKVLESMRIGQKAALDTVRSWSTTVEAFFTRLPDFAAPATTLKPTEFLENAFAFSEKVLASQREFAAKLFEASVPAARGATAAAQKAAAKA